MTDSPTHGSQRQAPEACTLPNSERPRRLAEFDDLFATAVRDASLDVSGRLRLVLDPDPAVASAAAGLAARETRCCAFFTFTLRIADHLVVLEVEASPGHADVVQALAERVDMERGLST